MPGESYHQSKAKSNYRFGLTIERQLYADWVVVALFYTALHCVDAHLVRNGYKKISDHKERYKLLANDINFRKVELDYELLANASRKARYFGTAADFPEYKLKLLESSLRRIANTLGQALEDC